MEQKVDFRELKSRVSMLDVARRYGVDLRQQNAHSFRGTCPLPTHPKDRPRSLVVSEKDGTWLWTCHERACAQAAGRKGGDVILFVALKEGVKLREAGERLASWYPTGEGAKSLPPSVKAAPDHIAEPGKMVEPEPTVNVPLREKWGGRDTLTGLDYAHPYLAGRSFDEAICREFGVGYFDGKGSMAGRVVFPVTNTKREIVAYAGRAVDPALEPRWLFPKGFLKGLELFGYSRAFVSDEPYVILVESFWGVMRLHQAGCPSAVALMGKSLSDAQAELLFPWSKVIVMLDGDPSGRESAPQIVHKLAGGHFVREVRLSAQPDSMTPEELRWLILQIV